MKERTNLTAEEQAAIDHCRAVYMQTGLTEPARGQAVRRTMEMQFPRLAHYRLWFNAEPGEPVSLSNETFERQGISIRKGGKL